MKILLLGSHLTYNLEHYVKMNLEKMGHNVVFYGYREKLGKLATPIRIAVCRSRSFRRFICRIALNKINEEIEKIAKKLEPDIVLSIKGEAVEPQTIEHIKNDVGAKAALWFPDDPRFFNSLIKHIAPSYDYVFTASEKALEMYKEITTGNVFHLPFACDPTVHKKVKLNDEDKRRYGTDVVFVGTYCPRRAKFIRALEKARILVKVYGPYWDYFKLRGNVYQGIYGPEMVKSFSAAKIVLNVHVDSDLEYKVNMRTFEAAASRACMLTDQPYGLDKLFRIDKELVTFEDEQELIDLVKFYLDAEDEREEMALRGMLRAHKEHTYRQRATSLLEASQKIEPINAY